MYVIVAGCGRLGSYLATLLSKEGHDVVVVSRNREEFSNLGNEFSGEIVEGVEFDIDTLKSAGIEKADAFAAVTGDDNTNIVAAKVAKKIFNVPIVVARVFDPVKEQTFKLLGIDCVCPTTVGAFAIYSKFLTKDKGSHFFFYGEKVELLTVVCKNGFTKKKVGEIEKLGNLRVVVVNREEEPIIPNEDFELKEGDEVLVALKVENLDKVKKLFNL